MSKEKKRVLCTGSAGFIGSHTVDLLVEKGHEVFVIDDFSSPGSRKRFGWKLKKVDITNRIKVLIAFADFEPDYVIHLAAQPSLLSSVKNPGRDASVNILGTINIIQAAMKFNVQKLVFSSTGAVYQRGDTMAHIHGYEDDYQLQPNRPYGLSKYTAEKYIRMLFKRQWVILRYGNVYGERQVPLGENQLIPRALGHIYNGDEFEIYGDGRATRDFVYVKDVAEANLKALEYDGYGIFNIATGQSKSVNKILDNLKEITGFEGDFKHGNPKGGEPVHVGMSVKKAQTDLKWKAKTGLRKGLEATEKWWKEAHAS